MATLELVKVSKQVGQTTILDAIDISITRGEFLVVVGPSGCGKSTLLRLIAGLDNLTDGKILLNNQCVNNIPAAKRDMAMVFQQYALYPHMTVFNNMAYGLKMRRVGKDEIKRRVLDTAELLRLTPYLERKPRDLSGGQKQRVAMGRAMVRSPSVFLFDEPLSNLDAKLRTDMRHEIKKIHKQFNTTSLYVTHDQTEAMTMAERILVLNKGCVEQIGTPWALYQEPATLFVAGFTGHYPVNFIDAVYNKTSGTIDTALGLHYPAAGLEAIADKTALVLAIRSEHLQAVGPKDAGIQLNIEFVDEMGADRLVQGRCPKTGLSLQVRCTADKALNAESLVVTLPQERLHIFDKQNGLRLGKINSSEYNGPF